ncbi:MAG: polysaccharide biosynthesis tyrosine autokinase [Nitrospirae bacterium]|nr:polysaccharide biosynthesis tyrosine autokinase [Nitrospirota bacterium]
MVDTNQERALEKPREYPLSSPLDYYDSHREEEVHLRDYWRVILRRRWTIITFFLVVVTTVTLASFLMRPLYKAKANIQIDKESPNILYFKDVYAVERPEQDYYQTQYKILQSRNLAKKVIKTLNLDKNSEFIGDQTTTLLMVIKDWFKDLFSTTQKDKEKEEEGIKPGLIDNFLSRLEITPVRGSRLVTVGYSTHEPELSAKIANTIARSFIDFNLESKIDATQQARDWLEKQLESLKARVESSEERLNKYARENEIIGIDEKQNIVTQRLADLSTALNQATAERTNKEALYKESDVKDIDSIPAVINNTLIQKLTNDYTTLEVEYFQLSKLYKPEYPKMVRLKEQMNKLNASINKEQRKIINSIKSDYQAALKRENYLKTALNKQKAETFALNQRSIQYNILKREADTNKELYNGMLQRLKETGVSAGISMSNILILDRAEVPQVPDKPKKKLNILLAVLIGIFGGIGLAFFMEYLDNTVKTHDDIERFVQLPFLGIVPLLPAVSKGNPRSATTREIAKVNESSPQIAEAYRNIRTSILYATPGMHPKVIVLTSTKIGEGKTTTAINIAHTFIQTGGKVLLVDGDMRRSVLYKLLNIDNSIGLSDYLSGQKDVGAILKKTSVTNLYAITSGPIPPNPSELLGSKKMTDLIDQMKPLYDYIIIDSPPIFGVSDGVILSTIADGVIIVIQAGETPREAVQRAKKVLFDVDANVLGVVLNGINLESPDYGYYYHYYYNYYYSDKDKKRRGSSRGDM